MTRSLLIALAFVLTLSQFYIPLHLVEAASAPPQILTYQGRLTNSSGNLITGTYYFKFSIWSSPTVGIGTQLWPVTAHSVSAAVTQGVFAINIGDTANGYPDTLNLDFSSASAFYLEVKVSSDDSSFETLSPRQPLAATPYALIANAVVGTTTPSAFGTTTPTAGAVVTIAATSTAAISLSIEGFLNQAANLFQIRNNSGTSLFSIGATGDVTMTNATSTNFFTTTASSTNLAAQKLTATYASTTALTVSGTGFFNTASTTNLVVSGLGGASGCLTPNSDGSITTAPCSAGTGAAFAWTPTTYAGSVVNATSTALWLKATTPFSLIASTTFVTYASTTALSSSNLTSGRVTYAGTSGILQDSTNLTFDGTTLTANTLALSNALTVANGGTGVASVADGNLVYGGVGGTAALVALATSTGGFLTNSYTTGRPVWTATSSLNVALANTTGTLPVSRGGTGVTSFTANSLLYSNADGTALAYAATSSLNIGGNAATVTTAPALSGAVTSSGASNVTSFGTLAQGVLGNPASAATIPTAQATSTLYGNTATFLTSGNVGIGTTTPNWNLQVAGAKGFLALSDTGAAANLKHWTLSSQQGVLFFATSSDALATSTVSALTIDKNGALTVPSIAAASGSNCLQTDTTGKITNTGSACAASGGGVWPFTTTDTNYGVAVQSTTTPEWFKNGLMASTTAYFVYASTTALTVTGQTSLGSLAGAAYSSLTASYLPKWSSGTWANSLVYDDGTNVGIGTTTPTWLVNPSSATASQLALSSGAGFSQWAFRNAGGLLYLATTTVAGTATSSMSALTINANGYLGIGSTTPTATLSVNGGIYFDNGTTTLGANASFNINDNFVYDSSTGTTSISNLNIGALNFDTDAGVITWVNLPLAAAATGTLESFTASIATTSILTVAGIANGDGSVGRTGIVIGTSTTPYAKLHVTGEDALSTNLALLVANSASTTLLTLANDGTFYAKGNVGIGTTTPTWLLNPSSATASQLALSSGAGFSQWAFRNAGGILYIATT
ncbi:MAG: hypothetical protein Q7S95_02010, partial [bacterium]|nr:hypothetical protein [bacterium]